MHFALICALCTVDMVILLAVFHNNFAKKGEKSELFEKCTRPDFAKVRSLFSIQTQGDERHINKAESVTFLRHLTESSVFNAVSVTVCDRMGIFLCSIGHSGYRQ